MRIEFAEIAKKELQRAHRRYERQWPGLGHRFVDEIQLAIASIKERPDAWIRLDAKLRRRNPRRFPYHLVYAAACQTITIIAVAHHRRRPGYWRRRIGQIGT